MAKVHTLRVRRLILKTDLFRNIQDHNPSTELAEYLKKIGLHPRVTHAWFSAWERAFSSDEGTVVEGITLQLQIPEN